MQELVSKQREISIKLLEAANNSEKKELFIKLAAKADSLANKIEAALPPDEEEEEK